MSLHMGASLAMVVPPRGLPPMSSVSRTASWPNIGTFCRTRRPGTSRSAVCRCSASAFQTDTATDFSYEDTTMRLKGNTIFITGGRSGIGRGLAEALHKLGNKVIIAGRRRSHLDAVVAANPGMVAIELDITDAAGIERVAAQLIKDYPDLNVVINNAGIMQPDTSAGRVDDA